jgi:hypothetical protein
MIIYMDENLPPHLAEGFQVLQAPEGMRNNRPLEVRYIPTAFYRGVPDEEWIPLVGKENGCVLTRDININRQKHELELYRKHKLGLFFLRGASKKQGMSVWEMVRTLAKHWEDISRIVYEEERPFAYQVTLGRKLKRL